MQPANSLEGLAPFPRRLIVPWCLEELLCSGDISLYRLAYAGLCVRMHAASPWQTLLSRCRPEHKTKNKAGLYDYLRQLILYMSWQLPLKNHWSSLPDPRKV